MKKSIRIIIFIAALVVAFILFVGIDFYFFPRAATIDMVTAHGETEIVKRRRSPGQLIIGEYVAQFLIAAKDESSFHNIYNQLLKKDDDDITVADGKGSALRNAIEFCSGMDKNPFDEKSPALCVYKSYEIAGSSPFTHTIFVVFSKDKKHIYIDFPGY